MRPRKTGSPSGRPIKFERPNIPIAPVLEHFGADLSRARHRGWSKIPCPFHSDSDPSGSVNLELNRYFCWSGCLDKTEDTVGLVMWHEGLDFLAALAKAESITGQSHERVRGVRRDSSTLFGGTWHR